MKKAPALLLLFVTLALAITWLSCDSGSNFAATNQFAFVRPAPPTSSSSVIAKLATQRQLMEHRQSFRVASRIKQGKGLKPMDVVIQPGTDSVVLMNNDGSGTEVIADQAGWFESVQLGPDGKKAVAVIEDTPGNLQVYYVDLSNKSNPIITQLTTDSEDHWGAQISWDGNKVVFTKYVESAKTYQLTTVSRTGANWGPETVIPTSFEANYPAFAPDGRIVFEDDDKDTIDIINADGTGLKELTTEQDTEHSDWAPSVSPDGQTVIFGRDYEIYSIPINGGTPKKLTTGNMSWDAMFVNNKIVYIAAPEGASSDEIFSMDVNGSNPKQLTTNSVDEFFEGWWY